MRFEPISYYYSHKLPLEQSQVSVVLHLSSVSLFFIYFIVVVVVKVAMLFIESPIMVDIKTLELSVRTSLSPLLISGGHV